MKAVFSLGEGTTVATSVAAVPFPSRGNGSWLVRVFCYAIVLVREMLSATCQTVFSICVSNNAFLAIFSLFFYIPLFIHLNKVYFSNTPQWKTGKFEKPNLKPALCNIGIGDVFLLKQTLLCKTVSRLSPHRTTNYNSILFTERMVLSVSRDEVQMQWFSFCWHWNPYQFVMLFYHISLISMTLLAAHKQ